MKFGKRLKQQVQETLPDWRDKFLSYKELKKLVRLISSAPSFLNGSSEYGKSEAEFVRLLNCEIDKFNVFFMEQEEDFIIRHEPSEAEYKEQMGKIRKDIVNLHGEMVLLENYSNINYTDIEKYDKRTGGLLRLAFIRKVLEEPFFITDLVSKLENEGRETITVAGKGILRNAIAALMTMKEIRRGSSTYSHFSLPPLNLTESDLIPSFQLNSPISVVR
ncbi:SPX domain-containing protein [Salix suchowensis]|nr:SPX domain-containing protein [Salix suchowensis]